MLWHVWEHVEDKGLQCSAAKLSRNCPEHYRQNIKRCMPGMPAELEELCFVVGQMQKPQLQEERAIGSSCSNTMEDLGHEAFHDFGKGRREASRRLASGAVTSIAFPNKLNGDVPTRRSNL